MSKEANIYSQGLMTFKYTQSDYKESETYTRTTFALLMTTFGGFISLVTRITNLTLRNYQSFTIDKSMIKKIYSWKEPNLEHNKSFFEKDPDQYHYDPA